MYILVIYDLLHDHTEEVECATFSALREAKTATLQAFGGDLSVVVTDYVKGEEEGEEEEEEEEDIEEDQSQYVPWRH